MSRTVTLEYRAFIAYSHSDARWAKWLHRWLEAFRVDRDLFGRDATGTIHKTLRPIFRDRDDITPNFAYHQPRDGTQNRRRC